jgi:hypothetical protein
VGRKLNLEKIIHRQRTPGNIRRQRVLTVLETSGIHSVRTENTFLPVSKSVRLRIKLLKALL